MCIRRGITFHDWVAHMRNSILDHELMASDVSRVAKIALVLLTWDIETNMTRCMWACNVMWNPRYGKHYLFTNCQHSPLLHALNIEFLLNIAKSISDLLQKKFRSFKIRQVVKKVSPPSSLLKAVSFQKSMWCSLHRHQGKFYSPPRLYWLCGLDSPSARLSKDWWDNPFCVSLRGSGRSESIWFEPWNPLGLVLQGAVPVVDEAVEVGTQINHLRNWRILDHIVLACPHLLKWQDSHDLRFDQQKVSVWLIFVLPCPSVPFLGRPTLLPVLPPLLMTTFALPSATTSFTLSGSAVDRPCCAGRMNSA